MTALPPILSLASVIAGLEATPYGQRFQALVAATRAAGGEYTPPNRETTHLHELTLLGVHARGEDEENLARNWLVVARNFLGVDRRPTASPADAQLEATFLQKASALTVLARPDLHDGPAIKTAAEFMLQNAYDPAVRNRAMNLLDAIRRETAEAPKCVVV